jgi:hypothetical protein
MTRVVGFDLTANELPPRYSSKRETAEKKLKADG